MQELEVLKYTYMSYRYKILGFISKAVKIYRALNNIDIVEVGDNVFISIKGNMVVNHTGSILINSKDGYLITKHKRTHINPAITIKANDIDRVKKDANSKALLLEKMSLFNRLLNSKKIISK